MDLLCAEHQVCTSGKKCACVLFRLSPSVDLSTLLGSGRDVSKQEVIGIVLRPVGSLVPHAFTITLEISDEGDSLSAEEDNAMEALSKRNFRRKMSLLRVLTPQQISPRRPTNGRTRSACRA